MARRRGDEVPAGGLGRPASLCVVVLLAQALAFDPGALDPAAPKAWLLVVGCLALAVVALTERGPSPALTGLDLVVAAGGAVALLEEARRAPAAWPLWPASLAVGLAYLAGRCAFAGAREEAAADAVGAVVALACAANVALHLLAPPDYRATWLDAGLLRETRAASLVGTFSNPNLLGGWLLLGLPALARRSLEPGGGAWSRAGLAVTSLVLAWTACRSAWLVGLVVFALAARAAGRRPRTWAVATVALLAMGVALGGGWKLLGTRTLLQRGWLAEAAVRDLAERPLDGWGPGGFERVAAAARPSGWRTAGLPAAAAHAHLLPLDAWGEVGPAGPFLLVLLVGLLARLAREGGVGAWSLAVGALAFVADNLANVTAFSGATAALFFAVVGSLAGTAAPPAPPRLSPPSFLPPFLLLALSLALLAPLSDAWTAERAAKEARTGAPASGHLMELWRLSTAHPGHPRLAYDLAGRLAMAGRFEEALAGYALVEAGIPGWQDLRTNRGEVARVLSDRGFDATFPLKDGLPSCR